MKARSPAPPACTNASTPPQTRPNPPRSRKKTKVFQQENYVENFVQSTFDALKNTKGKTLVVGGDGRFYNDVIVQKIVKMAAANGYAKCVVGQHGLLSTPAVSVIIRERDGGVADGGFILTASHNPGGPDNDCGIKYNREDGGPAPESLTNAIFERTKTIDEFKILECPDVDLKAIGTSKVGEMEVEIISPTDDYVALMKRIFDFDSLRAFVSRKGGFSMTYDGMSGVVGPYAKKILIDELGVSEESLVNCDPSPDFNGGHPDPNLTYAPVLVKKMGLKRDGTPLFERGDKKARAALPDFGAAADGDADRNMVLGSAQFVSPSDSVAIIAAYATRCVPWFQVGGLKGLARSMPTSEAVDKVAAKLVDSKDFYEVPTGWKFFVSAMKLSSPLICGEESFGTGSDHIREKDGLWAVLCWLSLLAFRAKDDPNGPIISVEQILIEHWREFGRNYYSRYDYEEVDSSAAKSVMDGLTALIAEHADSKTGVVSPPVDFGNGFKLNFADQFSYEDPVDSSVSKNQGWRFGFVGGSRFVFRLSGTGSVGATIRLYLEKYEPSDGDLLKTTNDALGPLIEIALKKSQLEKHTGRFEPTVIT